MPKTGCPVHRARDRAANAVEEAAGQAIYQHPIARTAKQPKHYCLRCWVLPKACLEILPVPNSTKIYNDPRSNSIGVGIYSRVYKLRPFRLHVSGLSHEALDARLERLAPFVKDPLNSQFLRHPERDIFWSNSSNSSYPDGFPRDFPLGGDGDADGGSELLLMWSYWEKGYGDVIANTLLPFGEMLRAGAMPRHLAIAGLRHAALLPPLRATTTTFCATERPNAPLLPRCESTCWKTVRLCAPDFFDSTRDSWAATVALDAAAAMLPPHPQRPNAADAAAAVAAAYNASRAATRSGSAVSGGASTSRAAAAAGTGARGWPLVRRAAAATATRGPRELRVLIAARLGRRLLAGADSLQRACDGLVIAAAPGGGSGSGSSDASSRASSSVTLRCALLPAKAPQAAKVAALQETDVYVSVWGGDTVHALHLRRGSAIIEMRPGGFASGAPWSWLELHKRWVTRYEGESKHERPLKFYPLMLPTNASVITATERNCFERNEAKQRRWLAAQQKEKPIERKKSNGKPEKKPRMPDEGWLCYWNADLRADIQHLLPPIREYARRRFGWY